MTERRQGLLSTKVLSIMSAIVLMGAAAGVLIQWNPFAWAVDLEVVAGETFQGRITQVVIWLGDAEDRLVNCRAKEGDCSHLHDRVANLKAELARLTALKAKYGG